MNVHVERMPWQSDTCKFFGQVQITTILDLTNKTWKTPIVGILANSNQIQDTIDSDNNIVRFFF